LGLHVHVPTPVAAEIAVGEEIILCTHLHVRENELTLYGFASEQDRNLFRDLLAVSGVGPRLALTLLSAMSVAAIQRAIAEEEPRLLSRIPGIGKKTAQKIVLELKDKMQKVAAVPEGTAVVSQADAEVVEALLSLGYSVVEAQRAVQGLPRDVTDVGERLRLALRRLAP